MRAQCVSCRFLSLARMNWLGVPRRGTSQAVRARRERPGRKEAVAASSLRRSIGAASAASTSRPRKGTKEGRRGRGGRPARRRGGLPWRRRSGAATSLGRGRLSRGGLGGREAGPPTAAGGGARAGGSRRAPHVARRGAATIAQGDRAAAGQRRPSARRAGARSARPASSPRAARRRHGRGAPPSTDPPTRPGGAPPAESPTARVARRPRPGSGRRGPSPPSSRPAASPTGRPSARPAAPHRRALAPARRRLRIAARLAGCAHRPGGAPTGSAGCGSAPAACPTAGSPGRPLRGLRRGRSRCRGRCRSRLAERVRRGGRRRHQRGVTASVRRCAIARGIPAETSLTVSHYAPTHGISPPISRVYALLERKSSIERLQARLAAHGYQPGMDRNDFRHELAQQLRVDSVRTSAAAGSGHPTSSCLGRRADGRPARRPPAPRPRPPGRPGSRPPGLLQGPRLPLFYACLKAAGAIDDDELLTFRKLGSRIEGHPTPVLPWVDVATGSLGQGLPVAAGLALTAKRLDRVRSRVWACAATASWPRARSGRPSTTPRSGSSTT